MPPKAEKESLVLLINIGVTSPCAPSNPSLVEKAKNVAKRKIEKMIFMRPKDEVAIILMGSSTTKNILDIEHVEEFKNFEVSNWDMIQDVINLQSTSYCSNWVEALYVAMDFMKENICNGSKKKVILMSDFNEESDIISQFKAHEIGNRLCKEKIELITISEDSINGKPEDSLKISEILLKELHKEINGQHITFDAAIDDLRFYTNTKSSPFYYDLEIADKKIPIVVYVKIDAYKFSSWKKAKGEETLQLHRKYVDKHRNVYTKDETLTGYKYGDTFIPIEEEVVQRMSYKSGMKGYKVHSFTNRGNINLDYLCGTSTRIILPSPKVPSAPKRFYSLVQAMVNTQSVAIVRKIFRDNLSPSMVALFPCIDIPDEPWCLVEIALTFSENRRVLGKVPTMSTFKQLTSEQDKAVDNLIDSLTLPDSDDRFLPGCVSSPAIQHTWNMLAYRALNQGPLPPMEDELRLILEAPDVQETSKSHLQRITELFELSSPSTETEANEKKEDDRMQIDNSAVTKISAKVEDKIDTKQESLQKLFNFQDSDDVSVDELAADL